MAAACECWPALPRTAAVADVTSRRALPALFHERTDGVRETEQSERAEPPAHLEGLVAGAAQGAVPDLRAEVVHGHFDGTDLGLDGLDALFERAVLDGVQQVAGRRAAVVPDDLHQPVETFLVATAAQYRVIPLPGETAGHVAADAGAGADDETDWLHVG